mmetsp:Transcript_80289/g.167172  ORF Transcript_80289/g.167172 Transcript_80289/m.167172 type:complete len:236 (-) Transcript_80289:358-1065(-)
MTCRRWLFALLNLCRPHRRMVRHQPTLRGPVLQSRSGSSSSSSSRTCWVTSQANLHQKRQLSKHSMKQCRRHNLEMEKEKQEKEEEEEDEKATRREGPLLPSLRPNSDIRHPPRAALAPEGRPLARRAIRTVWLLGLLRALTKSPTSTRPHSEIKDHRSWQMCQSCMMTLPGFINECTQLWSVDPVAHHRQHQALRGYQCRLLMRNRAQPPRPSWRRPCHFLHPTSGARALHPCH